MTGNLTGEKEVT